MKFKFLLFLGLCFFCSFFYTSFLFASQKEDLQLNAAQGSKPANSAINQNMNNEFASISLISNEYKKKPVILVGYEKGMGLVKDINSYGNKGYGYDLLMRFSYFADVEFKFIEVEGSLFDAVNNGIVDMAGLYSKTDEREKLVSYGNFPVDYSQYALVTKGENDYFYGDPKAIDGKIVATYPGCPGIVFLDNYLKKHNISVKYIYDDVRNFSDLDAHFYLYPSDIINNNNFHTVLNLSLKNVYFFSAKNNKALMDFLDKKLFQFFVDNISFHRKLSNKYHNVDNNFKNRSLTQGEAEKINGKTFKVGYIDNHAPYQSSDAYGNPQGISIEVMDFLAKKFDFNVEYIPYDLEGSWILSENFDILISVTGERNHTARFYDATDSYGVVDLAITFAKDTNTINLRGLKPEEALKDKNIGILNYINFPYGEFFKRFPNAKIVHYTNTVELLKGFRNNDVHAIITTKAGADSVAISDLLGKYQAALHLSIDLNFQISQKLGSEYLQIFNTMIGKIPESEVHAIMVDEIAEYIPSFGSEQFFRKNLIYFIAIGIFVLLVIIGLIKIIRQKSTINVLGQDDITSLISLSKFNQVVDEILHKASDNEYELIMLDVDYFRLINNYYGTDKGTEVIIAMAEALCDAYKDTNAIITRRVAEQFIVFKKINEGRPIKEVVQAFVIPRIKSIVGASYCLKMSIGISKNSDGDEKINSLIDNATIAKRESKKVHKTSFHEFTEEMRKEANTMMDIIYRMEHAISNKEFKVHYQPKIDFRELKVMGAEALVRWIPPVGNPVYPGSFIPIMEKNGFISQLELYVFEEVCNFIKTNAKNIKMPKIAINISPITLSKTDLLKQMVQILKNYAVLPSQIEIEITESAIGDFEDSLPAIIKILHKIGFTVAMDDFGAGNSSLNRLSVINVDVLKLDKVFIDFHEDAPRGNLVVQQMISLAKQLGMKVVAEGIEQKSQAKWLQEIQCDIAQGFYFAKVLNETDFVNLLHENKQYSLS